MKYGYNMTDLEFDLSKLFKVQSNSVVGPCMYMSSILFAIGAHWQYVS